MAEAKILEARTTAIIPFTTDFDTDAAFQDHAARMFPTANGEVPFWRRDKGNPQQLKELAPSVQMLFNRHGATSGVVRRLLWQNEVRNLVVHCGWKAKGTQIADTAAELRDVELLFFPFGTGLLCFHFTWNLEGLQRASSDVLTDQISEHASRLTAVRRLEQSGIFWSAHGPIDDPLRAVLEGSALAAWVAKEPAAVNTKSLAEWFLCPESSAPTAAKLSSSSFCFQQNLVSFDRKPDLDCHTLAFRLANAFSDEYGAPEAEDQDVCVVRPRSNRLVGFTRQGVAAINWREDPKNEKEFETKWWSKRFFEIFELLYQTNLAQRTTLTRLAEDVTSEVSDLDFEQINEEDYARIRHIHGHMERWLLTMPGSDPGGLSDYVNFYQNARAALGVTELRQEVQNKSRLLNDIAEDRYQRIRQAQAEQEEAARIAFQSTIHKVGAIFIPFTILTGLLGINLFDTTELQDWLAGVFFLGVALSLVAWIAFPSQSKKRSPDA